MATVNEKMTALANAIRTKSGATGKLSLDGMISAVNGISTGGGTTTYQLWGAHTFIPNLDDVNIGRFVGAYTIPQYSIYGWFFDYSGNNNGWMYVSVTEIIVHESGMIEINATDWQGDSYCNLYDPQIGGWCDGSDLNVNNGHLLVYTIPNPITVSKNLYDLFYALYDNAEYEADAFDRGYEVGLDECSNQGLEALGTLCDWEIFIDSGSTPVLTVTNYHPFLKMYCEICLDSETVDHLIISPNESESWTPEDAGYQWHFMAFAEFWISNVRWINE